VSFFITKADQGKSSSVMIKYFPLMFGTYIDLSITLYVTIA